MLQSRIFVGMVLILIFAEVLGLYGYVRFQSPTTVLACSTDICQSLVCPRPLAGSTSDDAVGSIWPRISKNNCRVVLTAVTGLLLL